MCAAAHPEEGHSSSRRLAQARTCQPARPARPHRLARRSRDIAGRTRGAARRTAARRRVARRIAAGRKGTLASAVRPSVRRPWQKLRSISPCLCLHRLAREPIMQLPRRGRPCATPRRPLFLTSPFASSPDCPCSQPHLVRQPHMHVTRQPSFIEPATAAPPPPPLLPQSCTALRHELLGQSLCLSVSLYPDRIPA